ncbi:hypothetical protein LEP1GSC058_1377 [Leptospira fainei serovar Hurstbridge str. BUT 6]|uniref:Uncharacterized protein n=1 Tax=Leptospira fainei serovar Hurstbridge str. BUT 6 TaxID=1193011 RepID=S3V501_9LEPT|nr:hypothetical protein [Leptospira fainei]EPG76503.1 hypothetical protein LEP1GSC058_1377 [Leptospira fainei serovar Hurstbridge str. BUT 6]
MYRNYATLLLSLILLSDCNKADRLSLDSSSATGLFLDQVLSGLTYATQSTQSINDSWTCPSLTNCQNVYDTQFVLTDVLTITISAVTGASVLRLSVYGPGSALNGTNLLNGSVNDRTCPSPPTNANQNVGDSISTTISTLGVYRIAVGRDWGSSAGSSGNYTLKVNTTKSSMTSLVKTVTNTVTLSSGMQCP